LPHCWWGFPTPLCSSSGRPQAGPSAHYPYPSPWVAPSSQILGTWGYVEPLSSTPLREHFLLYFTQTFIVFKLYHAPRRGEACRSFIVRVKYEKGVLKPLEPLEFPEGEELLVRIIDLEERIRRLQKYKGVLGSVDEELLEEAIEEAEQL